MSGPWTRWEPVIEAQNGGLRLGAGAVSTGTVTQQGSLVVAEFFVRFGREPAPGSGPFLLVPPVVPREIDELPRRVGSGTLGDHSDGVRHVQIAITANAVVDHRRFLLSTDGRPSADELFVGADWPWRWAADDFVVGLLTYEAG